MDMEQLKLFLDTVSGIADGGMWVALLYIVCDMLLIPIAVLFTAVYLCKIVVNAMAASETATNLLKRIGAQHGLSTPGPLTNRELNRIEEFLNKCIKDYKGG